MASGYRWSALAAMRFPFNDGTKARWRESDLRSAAFIPASASRLSWRYRKGAFAWGREGHEIKGKVDEHSFLAGLRLNGPFILS
jgi:hypothetical protein